MKPILEVHHLWKSFKIGKKQQPYLSLRDSLVDFLKSGWQNQETFWALQDVSFQVFPGETLGIIGRNGAGKTTLLKILSRITPPTKGHIIARGRMASLLEVGTGFHPELTGRENIYLNGSILGLKKAEITRKFDEIVDFSGVEQFLDTPLKHYSSGMQLRLAFAVAAHLEPEILLIDEVLAVGDAEFQKKCLGKMDEVSKSGRTILFVSHNMESHKRLCQKGVLLEKGKIKHSGPIDSVITEYLQYGDVNCKEYPENSVIRFIKIIQVGNHIEIYATYSTKEKLHLPSLGFVIFDSMERPLFGHNPTLSSKVIKSKSKYPKSGNIKVVIREPRLLDGIYTVSIWFGNGSYDFFHDDKCLKLVVKNMTSGHQMSTSSVGHILPVCDYLFY